MKRILILAMVLLPLLESCDKGDTEKSETESIDFGVSTDKVIINYIEFSKYNNGPVPIRFDSLAKAYSNERLWFKMHYCGDISIGVYRGIDTIVESQPCIVEYSAEQLYAWGYVKKWEKCDYILDNKNQFTMQTFFGTKYVECDFSLNVGDSFHIPSYPQFDTDVVVDSIVVKKMENDIERRWFYLKGKYYESIWIEGIGDVYRGFHTWPNNDLVGDQIENDVLRYYEKGELVYDSHSPFEGVVFFSYTN